MKAISSTPSSVREAIAALRAGGFLHTDVPSAEDFTTALEHMVASSIELRRLADDGRRYHAALLSDALTEGGRAFGVGFDRAMHERLLGAATIDVLTGVIADWKTRGDKEERTALLAVLNHATQEETHS